MILSATEIRAAVDSGGVNIQPFDEHSLEPASYDLHVGPEGYTSSRKDQVISIKNSGILVLAPGDFGMVVTDEVITLDTWHVGRFGLRSSLARQGVMAAVGPQIDPEFSGRLLVGLANLSPNPVALTYGDQFLSLELHKLNVAAPGYVGPYQSRDRISSSDIDHFVKGEGVIYSDMVTTLRTLNVTVSELKTDLKARVGTLTWVVGVAVAVMAVAVTIALVRG